MQTIAVTIAANMLYNMFNANVCGDVCAKYVIQHVFKFDLEIPQFNICFIINASQF